MVRTQSKSQVSPWLPAFFIGGHPALDFVNTVSDRRNPSLSVDRLSTADDVVSWMSVAGLIANSPRRTAALRGRKGEDFAHQVCALREDAWAALNAYAEGRHPPPAPLGRIMAGTVPGMAGLTGDPVEPIRFPAFTPSQMTARSLLSVLGLHVLDALYVLPPQRVRACPRCGWLFHDTSKGGRRKWCSMRDCGNREKAARHYRAHK